MKPGTIMLGALDPFEPHAPHLEWYKKSGIIAYSIDQMQLSDNDSMNLLSAMSEISGRLAVLDAASKHQATPKSCAIIGFGIVGKAALRQAQKMDMQTTVFVRRPSQAAALNNKNTKGVYIDSNLDVSEMQAQYCQLLSTADIIVTSARSPMQKAARMMQPLTSNMASK